MQVKLSSKNIYIDVGEIEILKKKRKKKGLIKVNRTEK